MKTQIAELEALKAQLEDLKKEKKQEKSAKEKTGKCLHDLRTASWINFHKG